jgi:hypothetical protein
MIPNLQKILKEWSYRVGVIKPTNIEHLEELKSILIEEDWSYDATNEFIQNLTEDEDDKYVSIGYGRYKEKGKEKDSNADVFVKTDAGKYVKSSDQKSDDKGEKPKEPDGKDLKGKSDFDRDAKQLTPSKDFQRDIGKDEPKEKGDNESKQKHISSGYVKGAAPGNAGSMYNEIMSGEVSDLLQDNPDATEEDLVKSILDKYGDSNLAKQNSSSKMAGGLKTGELPDGLPKEQRELYTKTLIAVRSGKRKHQRSQNASNDLGWKNTETSEYFGDKAGLKKQEEDIKSSSSVVDLDGNEIPKDEIIELIRVGGGGDNPSDTATIIKNDKGQATILFTSDKDSTSAIIAQSSNKAEATQTDDAILQLGDDGKLSQSESEAVAGERRNYADGLSEIETKLKSVTNEPAKHLKDNFDDKILNALINSSAGSNSRKYFDAIKKSFSTDKKIPKTDKKYSDFLPDGSDTPPTDKQVAQSFLNYSTSGVKDLTTDQQKMIGRANSQVGGPDVDDSVEKIRKDSIDLLDKQIEELDQIKIDGVGLGTFIEGNNIWKQGHMDAIDGKKGVHKYRGMFETNHAGVVLDGNVLKKALGVNSKKEFLKKLQVDKANVQVSRTNRVTGSTGLAYIMVGKEKVPIMEKRQRTKDGPLGKLQTVYKWTPEFEKLIKDNQ